MRFQIVERYSICQYVFQEYGIDECPLYQHKGHATQVRVILICVSCLRCLYRRQVPERGLFRSETGSEKSPNHRELRENEYLQTAFTGKEHINTRDRTSSKILKEGRKTRLRNEVAELSRRVRKVARSPHYYCQRYSCR